MLAFIGGGNMAGSLIGGWLAAGHAAQAVHVAVRSDARCAALRARFGVRATTEVAAAVAEATTVVIAVKPQQVAEALRGLRLAAGTVVLSVVAGVRLDSLRALLGPDVALVRSMPNTPSLYGSGIAGLYAGPDVPPEARARAEAVLAAAGETCWVEREALLDAVTAVSGSGPAYVFLLAELMRRGGVQLGLPDDTARRLADRTIIGAACMLAESGLDAASLRAQVTSPGGTTQAALERLAAGDIDGLFGAAMQAAAARGRALGEELDQRLSDHPDHSPGNC